MGSPYAVLCDVDGVLIRGHKALPGAARFVAELRRRGRPHLFLTNSPDHSPRELSFKLRNLGLDVEEKAIYTATQEVAEYVSSRGRGARVFAVGSPALRRELERRGARLVETKADCVVVCGGGRYGTREIETAVRLVAGGAVLLTANRERRSPSERGYGPGCGAFVAPVETATGCRAYVIGKPNHRMIRAAERLLGLDPRETYVIGDSLDTDIDVGLQASMRTILVLSGLTSKALLDRSAIKPDLVYRGVGEIPLGRLP